MKYALPTVIVLGGGGYLASSMAGSAGVPVDFSGVTITPESITMASPRMSGYQANGGSYQLTATSASQPTGTPDVIELNGVDATFGAAEGQNVQVAAVSGVYDLAGATLNLSGGAVVTTGGVEARMDSATVDVASGNLVSTSPVVIESGTRTLRGEGAEIAGDGSGINLTGRVQFSQGSSAPPGIMVAQAVGDAPRVAEAPASGGVLGGLLGVGQGPVDIVGDTLTQAEVDGGLLLTFAGAVEALMGETTINADTMVVNTASSESLLGAGEFQKMEATGHVRIAANGQVVTGDAAVVDMTAETSVVTGTAVALEAGTSRLTGNILTVEQATGDMTMERTGSGRVRLFAPADPAAPRSSATGFQSFMATGVATDITANSFSAVQDGDTMVLTFRGNVVADRGGSVLSSSTLVIYAPAGDGDVFNASGFDRFVATGAVRMNAGTQTASGDSAVMDQSAGTVVMTGNVTLADGNNVASGGQMTVDLATGAVQIAPGEGGRARLRLPAP